MIPCDLKGRTALVGGASKGIGRAIACQLADQHARVVVLARDKDALKAVVEELEKLSPRGHFAVQADYADLGSVAAAVNQALEKAGHIDIVVNNTGGPAPGPAWASEPDAYEQAFRQHLVSGQTILQLCLPGMKQNGFGRIINIISTSVKQPLPNLGVSNTVRAAVANWAKTLARELAPHGITVNNILPGATATDRLEQIIVNKAQKAQMGTDEVRTEMLAEIPVGRFGLPEELAYAAGFLASDAAAYINGINLPVDGGRTGSL